MVEKTIKRCKPCCYFSATQWYLLVMFIAWPWGWALNYQPLNHADKLLKGLHGFITQTSVPTMRPQKPLNSRNPQILPHKFKNAFSIIKPRSSSLCKYVHTCCTFLIVYLIKLPHSNCYMEIWGFGRQAD